jgi:hypothetical protein
MKNNKSFITIFYLLITFSGMSLRSAEAPQGYWDWFKEGMHSIKQAIYDKISYLGQIPSDLFLKLMASSVPNPRLVKITKLNLDQNKLTEFRYDVSRDRDMVKNIRKELGISGIYVADGSSKDAHKKFLSIQQPGQEYVERGFNVENDNSLSKCLSKLLVAMEKEPFMPGKFPEQDAYIQLFWEVEDALSKSLKPDAPDKEFTELAHKMYPGVNNKEIWWHLITWLHYSKRFAESKGLEKATRELRK